ncbi:hypothetical protein [Sphingomonas sp. 1185]|uniref:DUF5983 family protein n=1 Tax=Sphingomonas sp. 1185 TaxID=3156411 RepID=UPI003391D8C6
MRRFHTCVCSMLHLPAEERNVIEDLIDDSRAGYSILNRTDLTIVLHHDGYMIHVGVVEDHSRRPETIPPVLWRLLGQALEEGASWLSLDREEIPCRSLSVYPEEGQSGQPNRIAIRCRDCGGGDVVRDAWTTWDETTQAWKLGDTYDPVFCNSCDRYVVPLEVPLVAPSAELAI